MYKLYKFNPEKLIPKTEGTIQKKKVKLFSLSVKGEKLDIKSKLRRAFFCLITRGNFEIYYVCDGNKIIHTSYVIGKCCKFRFMDKNDCEIGPCWTHEEYRGRGIYPAVLDVVCSEKQKCKDNIYIFVAENNKSSVKGIEKSFFELDGTLNKKGFFNIYYRS